MSAHDNGGPAFPLSNSHKEFENTNWQDANGMTLRDYFAAKALQGLLSSEVSASPQKFAKHSYQVADAMLEARK